VRPGAQRGITARHHDPEYARNGRGPALQVGRRSPSSALDSHQVLEAASGAVCVGSNPTGGTFVFLAIWPLIWAYGGSPRSRVCSQMPPYAALGRDSRNISGKGRHACPRDHEQVSAAITVSDRTLAALHSVANTPVRHDRRIMSPARIAVSKPCFTCCNATG
jgi:hypothetical protein